jgi:transcriptional regulator with XRE-family HTH domain
MYIGKRVQELRKVRGMSLTELAEKSGVQIATLSRIENMKMTGRLESHMNIARALGVDVTQLYSAIIREESKTAVQTPQSLSDVFVHSEKSSYEILTSNILGKRMMPVLLKIEAGGETNKEQNPAGSEKFVVVLEGKIDVRAGEKSYSLAKYNTLYFDASLEHKFVNAGKTTAKVICVGTPVAL